MSKISLKEMTPEMYHQYFKTYTNDPALYMDMSKYSEYIYDEEKVNEYIKKQHQKNRITLAITLDDNIIGEIILKNIIPDHSVTLSISLVNDKYKNHGYGTISEGLVIDYVFNQLNIPIIYADATLKNTRSQHVLEKNGFIYIKEDEMLKYYYLKK